MQVIASAEALLDAAFPATASRQQKGTTNQTRRGLNAVVACCLMLTHLLAAGLLADAEETLGLPALAADEAAVCRRFTSQVLVLAGCLGAGTGSHALSTLPLKRLLNLAERVLELSPRGLRKQVQSAWPTTCLRGAMK